MNYLHLLLLLFIGFAFVAISNKRQYLAHRALVYCFLIIPLNRSFNSFVFYRFHTSLTVHFRYTATVTLDVCLQQNLVLYFHFLVCFGIFEKRLITIRKSLSNVYSTIMVLCTIVL